MSMLCPGVPILVQNSSWSSCSLDLGPPPGPETIHFCPFLLVLYVISACSAYVAGYQRTGCVPETGPNSVWGHEDIARCVPRTRCHSFRGTLQLSGRLAMPSALILNFREMKYGNWPRVMKIKKGMGVITVSKWFTVDIDTEIKCLDGSYSALIGLELINDQETFITFIQKLQGLEIYILLNIYTCGYDNQKVKVLVVNKEIHLKTYLIQSRHGEKSFWIPFVCLPRVLPRRPRSH